MQVAKRLNAVGIVTPLHQHDVHTRHFHGTIPLGAEHTMYTAGYLPDNEVFSRPEFLLNAVLRRFHAGFGAGSVYPQGRRHGCVHVFKPSPTLALNRQTVVFEAHTGVKTMTLTTPAMGNFHHNNHLPRWGYIILSIACAAMGVWSSYVTLEYFKHGARALESDAELQALALVAAMMFVASEMGAFLIAAMLTEKQLWARRWALTLFAFCVLGLEVCTIVAVQLALTTGADMGQATIAQREKDLRGRIADIESDAAINRDAGAMQATAAKNIKDAGARAWALQQAGKTVNKASSRAAELSRLHEQLEALTAQKRPTLVGILGKDNALYYAVARGILISMGGLVFFGTAGALVRMARNARAAKEAAIQLANVQPVTLEEFDSEPAKPAVNHSQSTTPAPSFARDGIAPKDATTHWQPMARHAGLALGVASLAGMAHALPTIAPTPTNHSQSTTPDHRQSTTPDKPKKARAKVAGEQMDTGTTGNAATRYNRVKKGVVARKIRPSINALVNLEGEQIGDKRAREYLDAMVRDGVLVKNEATNRWEYAPVTVEEPAIDPRQMALGGL